MPVGLAIVCLAAVVLLLVAEAKGMARLRALSKLTAAAAFIGIAFFNGALGSPVGTLIFAGLVLCAAGDAFLLSSRPGLFLAGMGAFAAGHALYIGAFLAGGLKFSLIVYGLGVIALAGVAAFFWIMRQRFGDFLPAVAGYCVIISAMLIASIAHFASGAPQGGARALAAAGFAVSDISVARDRFAQAAFTNRLWGLPLYFAAQCLFAFSV
jgi:uncharacterized membrane protein YhhN